MLEGLVRSSSGERALLFLQARGEGYPSEIARFYGTASTPIQNQLARLEADGVVYSRLLGNTRLYAFNPRYPFLPELRALLEKALSFCPREEREALLMNRRRPRRPGKPL
ncbi:MAG: DNA-binding protein [Planctomycetes bacterium SM23_25]|nr:MAG: DNA-binding protein [Planctomycetes bacterium SM23_25]